MKKTSLLILSSMALVSIASCNVEPVVPENPTDVIANDNIPTEIIAAIIPEVTKTQYTSEYVFGWTKGDQIRMPLVKRSAGTITACDLYTFTTQAESGSASATFIRNNNSDELDDFDPNPTLADGTWTDMGYLIYPHSIFNKAYSGNYPVVELPSSITYSATNPLDGGVVPMIGRKEGDTYKFSTAVAILKVTVSNYPSVATYVRLISSDKPLAGKFAVSDQTATVAQIANTSATDGSYTIELTASGLTEGETYDFYFPVPVGTYEANTLKIQLSTSSEDLLERTIGKAITLERNECLIIPELLYHRVYVKGAASAPMLYTVKPSAANTIRTHISSQKLTSSGYNSSEWVNGNKFGSSQNGTYNLANLKNAGGSVFLSATGEYYLQYIVSSDGSIPSALNDASVMTYGSVPFVYCAASDKITLTEDMLNVPYVSTAEGSVANLVDGNASTYWHSPYSGEDPSRNSEYGQIISIDLGEGNSVEDFYFFFRTRSGANNNHAKVLNVYTSASRWDEAGASLSLAGATSDALINRTPYNGEWAVPVLCEPSASYRYITVSIVQDSNGHDLRTSECTHMAEIEIYRK